MDVVKIVAWIDAQFSDEPAASASVPDWPLTEPVSADMIAQLHDACPDRVANYLLDRLARYAFTYNTHPFNGPVSGTTWYQKGKTNLDFT